MREKLRPEKTRINQGQCGGAPARIRCLADSRRLANSLGLFAVILIKIGMKLYAGRGSGWTKAGEIYSFRADFTGLKTAAKRAKFLTAPINIPQV